MKKKRTFRRKEEGFQLKIRKLSTENWWKNHKKKQNCLNQREMNKLIGDLKLRKNWAIWKMNWIGFGPHQTSTRKKKKKLSINWRKPRNCWDKQHSKEILSKKEPMMNQKWRKLCRIRKFKLKKSWKLNLKRKKSQKYWIKS